MSEESRIEKTDESSGAKSEPNQGDRQCNNFVQRTVKAIIEKYRAYRNQPEDFEQRKYKLQRRALWIAAAYAVVTCLMWRAMLTANSLTKQALTETRDEFRSAQRAQMVLGNEQGVLMELKNLGDKTKLVVYIRNTGFRPAQDAFGRYGILYSPPAAKLQYKTLFPAPGTFMAGTTIGRGISLPIYADVDGGIISKVKGGEIKMRIVGRIAYSDQFRRYCEAFSAIYRLDPPRFEAATPPPDSAVCDPASPDGEVFNIMPNGTESVDFGLRRGERLSPDQPSP